MNATDRTNDREYDAFGNTLVATGPMVNDFSFWFSTKYLDRETGLYYYGYRYYSPSLGRWLSRDPIGEKGGKGLYVFVSNRPISDLDALGLLGHRIGDKQNPEYYTCNCGWIDKSHLDDAKNIAGQIKAALDAYDSHPQAQGAYNTLVLSIGSTKWYAGQQQVHYQLTYSSPIPADDRLKIALGILMDLEMGFEGSTGSSRPRDRGVRDRGVSGIEGSPGSRGRSC